MVAETIGMAGSKADDEGVTGARCFHTLLLAESILNPMDIFRKWQCR